MKETAVRPDALFARTADGVFVSDVETHQIIYWNRSAKSILGSAAREVCGKHCHEVVRGLSADGTPFCGPDCPVKWAARTGRVVQHFDLITHAKSGRKIRMDVSILVVRDKPTGKIWVAHLFRKKSVATPHAPKNGRPVRVPNLSDQVAREIPTSLTRREREVFERMADGLSTRVLAARLGIRYLTARTHIQNILDKLGAHSRIEAILRAVRPRSG